jgi:beta-galactosidase
MILSGACHYFRTHPDQWRTRLHWLRLMGLDTVETYIAWNLHEPREGEYEFTGMGDIERWIALAADEGLNVIVRPGPFICAEWDNGGLPAWLTGRPGVPLRTMTPTYLEAVERWFGELLPRLAPLQASEGGPITMMQVENEYGSFGTETAYLQHLADLMRRLGVTVPLFTSDGPEDFMLQGGTVPGIQATVNFGGDPEGAFAALREHRPDDPPFCMEWWNGWFDTWGTPRPDRGPAEAAETLERMLDHGASVNIYMAHGGTNFGVSAGAYMDPPQAREGATYRPDTTSYDYGAPLDERGAPTPKFHAYRDVISRFRDVPGLEEFDEPLLPETTLRRNGEVIALSGALDRAEEVRTTGSPRTFEELGIGHGIVRYRTRVSGPRADQPLAITGLHDRAHLVIGDEVVHVFDRSTPTSYPMSVPAGGLDLELRVESMGRVNYGPHVGEAKGITGAVSFGQQELHGWSMQALDLPALPNLSGLPPRGEDDAGFHRFSFATDAAADTFIDLAGWTKGYVWVNGFNLGRYWSIGPQERLYVPAPVIRAGENEVVVLELDSPGAAPVLRPERR